MSAALITLGLLAVTNAARMAFVAWAVYRFGRTTGYWWSHLVIGSAFSVLSIALALALAIRIAFAGSGGHLSAPDLAGHGEPR
jgi:exosortase/archaeosortase family protein